MNYELAKQLKEAGFPQIRPNSISKEVNPFSLIYPEGQVWFEGWPMRPAPDHSPNAIHIDDTELKCLVGAYAPTLSELIAACGPAFSELIKLTDTKEPQKWAAVVYPCEECVISEIHEACGATPEEAVARLYIALHGK